MAREAADGGLGAAMEGHGGFAERDAVAVAQCGAFDASIVQQEHVAGAGGEVDEHELAGRASAE